MIPDTITIQFEGRRKTVATSDYITAATKGLRAFGYSTLTEDEVRTQLGKILDGQELSVIGMFMEKDIVLEEKEKKE